MDDAVSDVIDFITPYRPPLAFAVIARYLALRAFGGAEAVSGERYVRSVRLGGATGWLAIAPVPGRDACAVTIPARLGPQREEIVRRVRQLFDLDADPQLIEARLAADPLLGPRVAAAPGLRVLGAFEVFDLAVRAVLGQQVSVKGATTLATRLVALLGTPISTPFAGVTQLCPTPAELAAAPVSTLAGIGLPSKRAATLVALGEAVAAGRVRLEGEAPESVAAALQALPGIGPWTAQYVAMRALRDPDAFPSGDLGLQKALYPERRVSARELERHAEAWRPWRAYAAMHLWHSLG